jgi:flagellar basal body-associated protein FliL
VVLVAVVMEIMMVLSTEQQEQLILVAVAAVELVMAALGLSFFLFQHHDTQAQPQAHQQSRQAAQIQF